MATNNDAIINTNVSACGPHDDQPDHLNTTQTPIDNDVNNDGIDDQVGNLSDASTVADHVSDAEVNHSDTDKAPIDKLTNNDGMDDQLGNFSDASTSVEKAEQAEQDEQDQYTANHSYASTYYSDSDSDSDPSDEIPWIENPSQGIWLHNHTHVRQFDTEKRDADPNGEGEEDFSAEMIKDEEREGEVSEEMRAWIDFRFSDARKEMRQKKWEEEEVVKKGGVRGLSEV